MWHIVGSAPTTDPRWRKVERWVANAAPLVVPVLLNHDDFADIGTALSEYGEVEVSRMTARRRADLSSISRGWKARSGKLAELAQQRDVGIAVLHRNPYLHVVVTDYSDGSNFDVFVTDPSAISVHPGFRASMGALTRLTQRLGERFEALEIAEALPADAVSLDDLIDAG